MAFSFSNLFKSKSGSGKDAADEAAASTPPPVPKADAASAAPPRQTVRAPRVALPNSVQSISLRESPPRGPAGFGAAPPSILQGAGRSISFPGGFGGTPDETVVPDFAPSAPPPPEAEQVAPDITVTLELGDFVDKIPPAFLREGGVDRHQVIRFQAADLYSDLSKGRASVPLSTIYQICPDIFVRGVSATEDTEISLPLPKLVEQMAPSFRARADQLAAENVGQIETPFLQVALEDQARMPKTVVVAPAPIAAVRPEPPLIASPSPVAAPVSVARPASSSVQSFRSQTNPVPLAAITPVEASATPPQAPIIGDAAPAGKRLPATVRASVAGGKIRLSGPTLPSRPAPPPPPTGARPAGSIRPPGLQPPPTAQTAKKTARIQLPPIALKSASGSSSQAAPPPYRQQVPPAPPRPPAPPMQAAPPVPVAFKTPSVPAPKAPASPLPPMESSPLTPPPAPSLRPPLPVPYPAIRTTILPASALSGEVPPADRRPPEPKPAPVAPPPPMAIAPVPAVPPPVPRPPAPVPAAPVPPVAIAPAPVVPSPFAPAPVMPAAVSPAPVSPAASPAPAVIAAAPAALDAKTISLSLAGILRGLPATSLGDGMSMVGDALRIVFPFSLIEPQLAMGRVTMPRDAFVAALPADMRENFSANCDLTSIPIPLQEIFQNLPVNALSMRSDQVMDKTGPEIPTPFGQKAAEDAKRLQAAAPPAPTPAQVTVPVVVAPPTPPPLRAAKVELPADDADLDEMPEPEAVETVSFQDAASSLVDAPVAPAPKATSAIPAPAIPTAPLPLPPKLPQVAKLEVTPMDLPPLPPVEAPKPLTIPEPKKIEPIVAQPFAKLPEPPPPLTVAPVPSIPKIEPLAPPPARTEPVVSTPPTAKAPEPISVKVPEPTVSKISEPAAEKAPEAAIASPKPFLPPLSPLKPLQSAVPPPLPAAFTPVPAPVVPVPAPAALVPAPAAVAPAPAVSTPPPAPPAPVPAVVQAPVPLSVVVAPPPPPRAPVTPRPPAPAAAAVVTPRPPATALVPPRPPVAVQPAVPPVAVSAYAPIAAPASPVAIQPPPLKRAALEDPMHTLTPPATVAPQLPHLEPLSVEEDEDDQRQAGMTELQSIFMTDETLDAKKVVRLVGKLPGITACTVMFADGLTLAGNFPKELDGEGFSAMSPQFYKRAIAFAKELNLGEMQTFSFYTDRSVLSFFMQGEICLSVMQTGRGFLPGVREKLMSVTQELSKMYSRIVPH